MNRIVKIGNKHFIETSYLHHAEPKRVFIRWEVLESNGYIPDPLPEWGARYTQTSGELANYQLYCGNGRYIVLVTPKHGTCEERPVPPPRVKATTDTRWDSLKGWQKYDKRKGWVCA